MAIFAGLSCAGLTDLLIVCDALGLDTSDSSFAYVARRSDGFSELVKETAERVIDCGKALLIGLGAIKDGGNQL